MNYEQIMNLLEVLPQRQAILERLEGEVLRAVQESLGTKRKEPSVEVKKVVHNAPKDWVVAIRRGKEQELRHISAPTKASALKAAEKEHGEEGARILIYETEKEAIKANKHRLYYTKEAKEARAAAKPTPKAKKKATLAS